MSLLYHYHPYCVIIVLYYIIVVIITVIGVIITVIIGVIGVRCALLWQIAINCPGPTREPRF